VLLLDKSHPVLFEAARARGLGLTIWGPVTKPREVFHISFVLASSTPLGSGYQSYILEDYLDVEVGLLGHEHHTPRKVIQWVSNKDGGAHYDPEKPRGLREIKAPLGLSIRRIDPSTGAVSDHPWPHDEGVRLLVQLAQYVLDAIKQLVDFDSDATPPRLQEDE
jgi:hypothetical protein